MKKTSAQVMDEILVNTFLVSYMLDKLASFAVFVLLVLCIVTPLSWMWFAAVFVGTILVRVVVAFTKARIKKLNIVITG